MPRPDRTDDELRAASAHLRYEVTMLCQLGQALYCDIAGESAIQNAFVESFTLHARALLAFFYPKDPREDDVIADDYFDDPVVWHNIRPEPTARLKVVHARVGKEIAHLTYVRLSVTDEAKQWNFFEIAAEIDQVVKSFLKHVPTHRLDEKWGGVLETLIPPV